MLEFLTLLTLLAQPIFYCILSIFGINVESGQMGILFIVIAAIGYIYIIKKNMFSRQIKIKFFIILGALLAILIFVFITVAKFGEVNEVYRGQILSFGSASIVACLLGYTLSQQDSIKKIGKWIPVFVIILTLVTFITTITSDNTTSGGQISSSTGLIYQNLSYYAAYSFGLNMYFIMNINNLETFAWARKFKFLFIILAFLEALTVLLGGGRGGFVLFLILGLYFLIINLKAIKKNSKYIFIIFLAILSVIAIVLILNYADVNTVGWERIKNFMKDTGDSNRSNFRERALLYFQRAPIFGNGIGSVIYYLRYYSHNIFTDLLCDTGLFGTSLFLFALFNFFRKIRRQIRYDKLNRFVFIVFIMGFTMSLFSGYYLSNQLLWFVFGFVFTYNIERVIQKNRS